MPQKHLGYSSAQKAIEILLAFVPDNREMGTLELSRLLGLNKSTVSRLIRVLAHYNLLQQDDNTKKYSLGRSAAFIGKAVQQSLSTRLVSIAQPLTNYLRDTIGESVCLEVMSGDHVYLVAKAVGPPPLSISFKDRIPIHAAAGAKSILAFSSPEVVERLIKERAVDRQLQAVFCQVIRGEARLGVIVSRRVIRRCDQKADARRVQGHTDDMDGHRVRVGPGFHCVGDAGEEFLRG